MFIPCTQLNEYTLDIPSGTVKLYDALSAVGEPFAEHTSDVRVNEPREMLVGLFIDMPAGTGWAVSTI